MKHLLRPRGGHVSAPTSSPRATVMTWTQFIKDQNQNQNSVARGSEEQIPQSSDESYKLSQEECTASWPWETSTHPSSFDPGPAPWVLMAQHWKKHKLLRSSGITFTTCEKPDRPGLLTPECQKMLKRLELLEFSKTPLPGFDPEKCRQFISSYAHPYNYGIVGGRAVRISPKQVLKLTGLPIGNSTWKSYVGRGRNNAVLHGILRTLEQPKIKLFSLEHLEFGDPEETRAFREIASLLMERFVCKPHPANTVMPQLILSMHGSLRERMIMKWAQVFATRLCKSAFYSRVLGKYPFFYGEWLTGLIEQQLSCESEYEVDLAGKQPELETTLKDMAKLEMDKLVLDYRIQSLDEEKIAG